MAKPTPSVNETWLFRCAPQIGSTAITGDTDDASVTYVATHNGVEVGSGSYTWEGEDTRNVWAKKFQLPATPGIFTVVTTVIVGDNQDSDSTSLYVEKYT